MNSDKVIQELNQKYPGKAVFKNNEENTIEILCEIDPSTEHPEYSNAIAVIDKSVPHIHYKTTETYKVIKGELTLYIGNNAFILKEGESKVIEPNNVHWAEGDETWIECYSKPGWTLEDQITAKNRDVAVVIFHDKDGNVGVQHRESYSKAGEKYGLWGGRKEEGETPEEAMKRELQEELNYIPEQLELWKKFTYVVDFEGDYLHWVINHDVFLSPITEELTNAKVEEGDDVTIMTMQEALDEPDFRLIKPLLFDLKAKLGI
jgi:8-oxo-dGTP diphosphatase